MASDETPSTVHRDRALLVVARRASATTSSTPAASAEREKQERSRDVAASPYLRA